MLPVLGSIRSSLAWWFVAVNTHVNDHVLSIRRISPNHLIDTRSLAERPEWTGSRKSVLGTGRRSRSDAGSRRSHEPLRREMRLRLADIHHGHARLGRECAQRLLAMLSVHAFQRCIVEIREHFVPGHAGKVPRGLCRAQARFAAIAVS